jgi:hypothetical protein
MLTLVAFIYMVNTLWIPVGKNSNYINYQAKWYKLLQIKLVIVRLGMGYKI